MDLAMYCEYCEWYLLNPRLPNCKAEMRGYACTREKGYKGLHVACGTTDHQIIVWPNEEGGGYDYHKGNSR